MMQLVKRNLSLKVALSICSYALITGLIVGSAAYLTAARSTMQQIDQSLKEGENLRARSLEQYEKQIVVDMHTIATVQQVEDAIWTFSDLFQGDREAQDSVRAAYTTDNPLAWGDRDQLDEADDGSAYSFSHKSVHSFMRGFIEEHEYLDAVIFDANGLVLYSVKKTDEFATNIVDGPFGGSVLSEAFQAGLTTPFLSSALVDFKRFDAKNDQPTAYVSTPIYANGKSDGTSEPIGVVALALSPARLSSVLYNSVTGGQIVSYLIGQDGLLRSLVPGVGQEGLLRNQLSIDVANADQQSTFSSDQVAGISGDIVMLDSRPVNFLGLEWRMVAEKKRAEALSALHDLRNMILMIGPLAILIVGGMAFVFARSLTKPVLALNESMTALAKGDLDVEVGDQDRLDEIGLMAKTVEVFRENGKRAMDLEQEAKTAQLETERERERVMQGLKASLGVVVQASARGDFTQRVDSNLDDPTLREMANGLNELVASVDAGLVEVTAALSALAAGDLTVSMSGEYEGAFADLQSAVNETFDRLRDVVGQCKTTSEVISGNAEQIMSGASDLAQRAESQAASLEQTSATMDQMAANVEANAKNSLQASQRAADAQMLANKGKDVVANAVRAMGAIEESSSAIAEIISVIEGIAFQTNLLALNAAVEAARAGDAGKGFSVVASEVRALAHRSSEAANNVNSLISAGSGQVAEGVKLVNETGTALENIINAISEASRTVAEISTATQEQSTGIAEISSAVAQLDGITQQNSQVADISRTNSVELSSRSADLLGAMEFFKTGQSSGEAAIGKSRHQPDPSDQQKFAVSDVPLETTPAPEMLKQAVGGAFVPANESDDDDEWASF